MLLYLSCTAVVIGQTAEDYIGQGRALLACSNVVSANLAFSNAVARSPNHQTANLCYGLSRLLVWPYLPVGSNYLTRLGVPTNGRDLFAWTAIPPSDTNHVPFAPAGVNGSESTALLRTNVLPALIAAEANLAKVTDTNFAFTLTAEETLGSALTLDYGDVQLLRAFLQAGECGCYLANEWNFDAQLSAIRSIAKGQVSVAQFLLNHPKLLTFTTTNDLYATKTTFVDAVNRYFSASQWLRERPINVVRLFNYDGSSEIEETAFRQTLADLTNSLSHAVTLQVETNYAVYLGAHFSGQTALRDLLPTICGNSIAMGTLPDPTFGGVIYGISAEIIDSLIAEALAPRIIPIPTISPAFRGEGPQVQFRLNVAKGRGYVIQSSSNLLDWEDYAAFFGLAPRHVFADPGAFITPRRFYRLVDRTENMPIPGNDNFADRTPLVGSSVVAEGYNSSASAELGEPGMPLTVWWSWTATVSGPVVISTIGSEPSTYARVYAGSSLPNLNQVAWGDTPFYATAGTTYQIQVGNWDFGGGIRLTITAPPVITLTSPQDGTVLTEPANLIFQADAADSDGNINGMKCYANGKFVFGAIGSALRFTWTNIPPGNYDFSLEATDNLGITTLTNFSCTIRPANDAFANRIRVNGASAVVSGSNLGASLESGEPKHAGMLRGASVWWTWTSPFNGAVTISAELTRPDQDYWSAPALGVYFGSAVSNLLTIATNVPVYGGQPAQVSLAVTAGSTCQIAVDSYGWEAGEIALKITPTAAPLVSLQFPTAGAVVLGPTNITLRANATDPDGSISQVDFLDTSYSPPRLIGTSTTAPFTFVWSNILGGDYWIAARATDNSGISTYTSGVNFRVTPVNDDFDGRIALTGMPVTATVSSLGATKEAGEPNHGGNPGGASVWWSWISPLSGPVTMTADLSSHSTVMPALLGVYSGSSMSNLQTIASNQPAFGARAQVSFTAVAGAIYQIAVDGYYGSAGNTILNIFGSQPPSVSITYPSNGATFETLAPTNITIVASANDNDGYVAQLAVSTDGGSSWMGSGAVNALFLVWSNVYFGSFNLVARAIDNSGAASYSSPVRINVVPAIPPNDSFSGRQQLRGANVTVVSNNSAASKEAGEPSYVGYPGGKSVWWTWVAPYKGTFKLSAASGDAYLVYWPVLAVYSGDDLPSLREVATDVGYGYSAELLLSAQGGQTYQIAFDSAYGVGGLFTLTISPW